MRALCGKYNIYLHNQADKTHPLAQGFRHNALTRTGLCQVGYCASKEGSIFPAATTTLIHIDELETTERAAFN